MNKMENKINVLESADSIKKLNENKSKIVYKFKISDSTPNKKLFMGQCFLLDLDSVPEKKVTQSKSINKLVKLPSIFNKDENKIKILNNLPLQRSKSQKKRHDFRLNSIKAYRKPLPQEINTVDIYPPLNHRYNSQTIQTEPKNNEPDAFLNRINRLYYPKMSTIRYLTNLFEDNEKNDLRLIDLKKIKGNKKKKLLYKKDTDNKYIYMDLYNKYKDKKVSSFDEKVNGKANNVDKLKILRLEKQLRYFHKLKIKNCKDKVKETLNDLNKLKSKNMVFFERFKKECDFKFDDDLIY
jgi:hypothetical protein